MAKEITWMIRGETNTKTLGCGIWDKWALKDDLVIRRAKSEQEIIMELSRKDPNVNINELSLQLFNLVLKHTTIKEGATLKVNTSQASTATYYKYAAESREWNYMALYSTYQEKYQNKLLSGTVSLSEGTLSHEILVSYKYITAN